MEEILNVHLLKLFIFSLLNSLKKNNIYYVRSSGDGELSLKTSSVLIYFVVIKSLSSEDD